MEYHLWEESRQGIVCRTPLLTLPCTKCWIIQMRKDKRRDLRPRSSHPGSETHPKTDNPIYRGKSRVPPRWAVETEREWPAPPIKFRKPLPGSDIWAESWRMSKNSPFFFRRVGGALQADEAKRKRTLSNLVWKHFEARTLVKTFHLCLVQRRKNSQDPTCDNQNVSQPTFMLRWAVEHEFRYT